MGLFTDSEVVVSVMWFGVQWCGLGFSGAVQCDAVWCDVLWWCFPLLLEVVG